MSTLKQHVGQDSRRTSRNLPATAGVLVASWAVVLGVVVGFGWLITNPLKGAVNPWDNDVSRWFADQRTGALDPFGDIGTLFGETITGVGVAILAAIGFSLWQRSWRPALFFALAEAGIGGFYFVATHVDTRQRPPVKILDPGLVPDHSFPSGHVATAVVAYGGIFVLTAVYARAARKVVAVVLLLPLFVLLARMYQGAHHLTDVLTSVVYASVWLLVVARLVLPDEGPDDA
ncbi:phosphatase PAP2 family protein [Nocardioides sp. MAHUQ-72]|uniref:phosphatase PAP2 family protein n=1 Tax=unclassified Nocardioides TaxID=2615069 RepID=UPI003609DFA1